MILAGLGMMMVTPVLAEGAHTYRLQGPSLEGEFVVQPYWLAPGTIDGRHVRLQSGLLGFIDGGGTTGAGYCIDARAHRRHDAVYSEGSTLDGTVVASPRQVGWLLGHAFPNGPALLGDDPRGRARSSSAVQAAIWHFSDGFQLDPAGSPYVDAAYRQAYDQLVAQAGKETTSGHGGVRLVMPAPTVSVGHPAQLTAFVTNDDGTAVADGTEVTFRAAGGRLGAVPGDVPKSDSAGGPFEVRATGGRATVWLATTAEGPARVSVDASVVIPAPPGRILVANLPTQRLVETSWGQETVRTQAVVTFVAPVPPVPPSPPGAATPPVALKPSPPAAVTVVIPTPLPPVPALSPPTPLISKPPALPYRGETVIQMPATGHPARGSLGIALGLILAGAGILVGRGGPVSTPPRQVFFRVSAWNGAH